MILITGGTGYIGSHTVVELLAAGREVLILDNLSNSDPAVIDRIENITGKRPQFIEGDLRNAPLLDTLFQEHRFAAVIHFAGLKAVGESVSKPLDYYENNVFGSMVLFRTMQKHGVERLVFSSSATVYGYPETVPVAENAPNHATNPYGRTKLMIEEMLRDLAIAQPSLHIAILRYFNPIGAHSSGLIGESPTGIPNNLMPYICQVAAGKREYLSVFGNDYPTPDGTCIRDYIHVVDLAIGHLKALEKLESKAGLITCNLGTGQGYSVLDVIQAFETGTGVKIPYRIAPRRPGDVPCYYADPSKTKEELGWQAEHSLIQMCTDAWRWQQQSIL